MPSFDIQRFRSDGRVAITLGWRDHLLILRVQRYLWSAITALLTWASFALIFGWLISTIFVLCIFIHELGHALAAAICLLSGINIEFLPFFGAHTYFKENFASRADAVAVFLAGPALGLLAGWVGYAVYLWTDSGATHCFASWSMLFSLANLLPLILLDGGQAWAALLAPARVWLVQLTQLVGIIVAHLFLYWLGLPLIVAVPLLLLSVWLSVRSIRKLADAERIFAALGQLFGLSAHDVVAITRRVGDFPLEDEMLETASQARRRYRRFLVAATTTRTDDCWFANRWALVYYLQAMAQRPLGVWGKLLGWLLFAGLVALCLLLGYLLTDSQSPFISIFISALMLG